VVLIDQLYVLLDAALLMMSLQNFASSRAATVDVGEHLDSTTDQADQVTFRWEGFWGGAPWCPQVAKVWAVPTSFWQGSWVAQRGERELVAMVGNTSTAR
jgi:hypothetical protein